jgi:basic amino acid/polyamine antiporter, APA family
MEPARIDPEPIPARLSLWDTISIIVGIIVGVGIFQAPAVVFGAVSGPWQVLAVWSLGGVLSLLGALCFAELASTYPRSGGEYVYLTRAYGSGVGFLFAWAQLAVIRPGGGIAMPALIFAGAASQLWGLSPFSATLAAALAIALLTLINILGANPGKRTQNVLTLAKVLSLGGIVIAGFAWARPRPDTVAVASGEAVPFVVMMMAVLYAYDGWNEAAYVSSEVSDRRRNLPLALILGTTAVAGLYLLINGAYLVGFGFDAAREFRVGPELILRQTLGPVGSQAMSVLVMVAVLGALTGMIFTGSRMFSELGADHRIFAPLGWWNPRLQTPVCSLLVQAAISIGMVLGVGLVWQERNGFNELLECTAPVLWLFFMLTGLALFVLRYREPNIERPFRVPLYPVVPLLFCGWSGFMLYGSVSDKPVEALIGLAIFLAGVPLWLVSRRLPRPLTPGGPVAGPHRRSWQWSVALQQSKAEK